MRRLVAATIAATTLTLAATWAVPAYAADADASVHQIYEAAEGGHLDQAQGMMDQVLKDHPQSARAHYVQAELYAKEGKLSLARSELAEAERLKPGLPGENPQSVQRLKSELGVGGRAESAPRVIGMNSGARAEPHFPWGTVLILLAVVGVLWMVFRRRSSYGQYPAGVAGGGPGGYAGPGGGYGPGYGPGGGMGGGGGLGSGIGGGLASGLAVGAGVVAGEELAHRFLDGRPEAGVAPQQVADNNGWNADNSNMGGNDFGVNDAGSGWDDSSGGGGGGGDDWT